MAGTGENAVETQEEELAAGQEEAVAQEIAARKKAIRKILPDMRPRDDELFSTILANREFARSLLAATLREDRKDIRIDSMDTEYWIRMAGLARGVRIDGLVNREAVRAYALEMENARERATPERMRYISDILDIHRLKPGRKFEELPTLYVIMYAPFSRKGTNTTRPVREFVSMDVETHEPMDDGVHYVTVDLNAVGQGDVFDMIHDLSTVDPADMRCPWVAERVDEIKNTMEEREEMSSVLEGVIRDEVNARLSRAVDKVADKAVAENTSKIAHDNTVRMLCVTSLTDEEIASALNVPLDMVQELSGARPSA